MIGPVPEDLACQIRPMPADFDVPYAEHQNYLHWRGNLIVETHGRRETIECEVGARFTPDVNLGAARQQLLEVVWHAKELARLGHVEGLKGVRVDRHAHHPVSKPQLADLRPSGTA